MFDCVLNIHLNKITKNVSIKDNRTTSLRVSLVLHVLLPFNVKKRLQSFNDLDGDFNPIQDGLGQKGKSSHWRCSVKKGVLKIFQLHLQLY